MQIEKSDIICREATKEDFDEIAKLWRQLFELHAKLDPIFSPAKDGHRHYLKWVKFHMDDENSVVLISEFESKAVAYCMAQVKQLPPVLEFKVVGMISDMAVHEDLQGRQIGRALYKAMEEKLLKMGVSRIELKTSSFNPHSNYFWETVCGFEEFVKVRAKNFG